MRCIPLLFAILFAMPCIVKGQNVTDGDWIIQVFDGEKAMQRQSYDSALIILNKAISQGRIKQYQRDDLFSYALVLAGKCYQKKNDLVSAHQNMLEGYQNAVRYKHNSEEIDAFTSLNQLHADILKKNIPFPYKKPETTIEEQAAFQVEKVEQKGDSIHLTIVGGYHDGITDSSGTTEIWSKFTSESVDKKTEVIFHSSAMEK